MEENSKIIRVSIKGDSTNKIYINNIKNISNIVSDDAYICLEKFHGTRDGILVSYIECYCNAIRDNYENDIDIGLFQSKKIDDFQGEYTTLIAGVNTKTNFNTIFNYENWIKIDVNDLDRLLFTLVPFCPNPLDISVIDFEYTLVFKIKFLKK